MKSKKVNKKSFSESRNSIVCEEENSVNETCKTDISSKSSDLPRIFNVSIDPKHSCSKYVKTRNAAFVHPSILRAAASPEYIVLKSDQNTALCLPLPLKTVKKHTIVLPKDNLGFKDNEQLSLYSYNKAPSVAEEVEVDLKDDKILDDGLEKQIHHSLSSRKFICCGIQLMRCDPMCSMEFTITNIKSSGENFKNKSSMLNCDESFNNSNLECSQLSYQTANDSINNIDSLMCSLSLKENNLQLDSTTNSLQPQFSDSLQHDSVSENLSVDSELSCQIQPCYTELEDCTFFIFNSETKISCLGLYETSNEDKNVHSFDNIGGLVEAQKRIQSLLDLFLRKDNKRQTTGVLLLVGPSGTGKSMIMKALQQQFCDNNVEISWCSLYAKDISEAIDDLKFQLDIARKKASCIILMDDFQFLCPTKKNLAQERILSVLNQEVDKCKGFRIALVASTNTRDFDDSLLKSHDISVEEIQFTAPSAQERKEIIFKLLEEKNYNLTADDVNQLSLLTQGFSGRDLKDVLSSARSVINQGTNPGENSDVQITFSNIEQVLKYKKPSLRTNLKIKEVRWSDIGGMESIKSKLRDIVELPLLRPEVYSRLSVRPSRGVLLYGPPGCSKTMIAKAIANEANMHFIAKNVSDIHHKYVGESEKAVSRLFLEARAKAPCIVFLDEIDALIPLRGSGSGVESKVVSLFLQEMDGFLGLEGVVIIAATNRPDRIDAAFLRSGRIDELIYVPLPDSSAREEILRLQMTHRTVEEGLDYGHLAQLTHGYSGAEIVNLCNEAALQLLLSETDPPVFRLSHFEKALQSVAPRTDADMLLFYENFNSKLGSK